MEKYFNQLAEALLYSYIYSFLAAPLISGYILHRYVHIIASYIIVFWIIGSGYIFCKYSYHGFEAYVLGNFLFVGASIIGQSLRAKAKHVEFWSQNHTDWILVGSSTLVYMLLYVRPIA